MTYPNSKEINFVRCLKCGKIMRCSRYDTATLLEHIRTDHSEVQIVDTETQQRSTKSYRKSPEIQNNSLQDDIMADCDCSNENCDAAKCAPYNGQERVSYENEAEGDRSEQWPRGRKYVKDIDLAHYSATAGILEKYPEIKECEYAPHNPNAQVIYTRRYKVTTPSSVSMSVLQQPFQNNLYRASIEQWRPASGSIFCPKCGCNKRPLIKRKSERFTYNDCFACCILSCWPLCFIPWFLPKKSNDYLHCENCKTFLGLYDHSANCIRPNRLYFYRTTASCEPNKPDRNDFKDIKALENQSPAQSLAVASGKSKRLSFSENLNEPISEQENTNRDSVKSTKLIENKSSPQGSKTDSSKPKRLPSIVIDGKELPPETVARLQKLKKYGSLVGINIDALTKPTDSPKSTAASSVMEQDTQNVTHNK